MKVRVKLETVRLSIILATKEAQAEQLPKPASPSPVCRRHHFIPLVKPEPRCCISAVVFPPGQFYFSLRHQWFQVVDPRRSHSRAEETEVRIPHGEQYFSEENLLLFVSEGEKSPNGMPLRREREVARPFRLERARRRTRPPGELLSGRWHSKWGELLYISGGISPWATLLFPEASPAR